MNKKNIKSILIFGLSISTLAVIPFVNNKFASTKAEAIHTCYVDFFNNYLRQDFVLSSGYGARGNNIVFKSVGVPQNTKVEQPENPVRRNYEFKGWYKEEACVNAWNFSSDVVEQDTRLFAPFQTMSVGLF